MAQTARSASVAGVLDASFADRVAVLMRSRPIVDGLRAATHQEWPEGLYDIATFALAVIDLVISRQGFDEEVTPEEAVRQLTALAAATAPDRPALEHERAARYTLDLLLNQPNRGRNFAYEISDFIGEGHLRRSVQFWLLRRKEDPVRGAVVLNASSDAINALIGGLQFDVTDEQVATEAMLERQLARGAFDAAERSAQRSRVLSLKLTEDIQSVLNDTRRDVRSVLEKWTYQVPQRLDEAREHISERLEVEHRLLIKARESLESDEEKVRTAAARIVRTLDECRERHQFLHREVMGAREVFLTEQDRQAFRPQSLGCRLI